MGNCLNSTHRGHLSVRLAEESPSTPLRKPLKSNEGSPDGGENSTAPSEDATHPLSPESLLGTSPPDEEPVKCISLIKGPDTSSGADQPQIYTLGPDGTRTPRKTGQQHISSGSSVSSISSRNTRQGRALQARLQKARYMQMIINKTSNSLNDLGSDAASIPEDAETTDADEGLPIRYTLSSETPLASSLNDEFEASLNQGMVWAEVECDSNVMSVALSRQKPSLNMSTPPLFLALGTERGVLTVKELLDESPLTGSTARLGSTMSLQRKGRIRSLDFSPDGSYLAIGGDDAACALALLHYGPDQELTSITVLSEVSRLDRVYCVQFSPNGSYLAVGGYDDTVVIVTIDDPTSPEIIAEVPVEGLVHSLDWSPDGRMLAIGGSDKICTLIDTENSFEIVQEIRRPGSIQSVQWHPKSGRYLAIASSDVVIIDRETMNIRKEIDIRGHADRSKGGGRSSYRVNNVCWSPNGSYMVINASNNKCKLLETKAFTTIHEISRSSRISCLVWGQQNVIAGVPHRYLAMGGDDKKVVILKAGLEVQGGASSNGDDTSAASSYFSNRGDWVLKEDVFRDMEGVVVLGEVSAQLQKQSGEIQCLAFSRGSKTRASAFFAVASVDGLVTIRSTIGWKVITQLEHETPVTCMAFSNGSRVLVLGQADGKVRVMATAPVWSLMTEVLLGGLIVDIRFSKNNELVSVLEGNGVLSLFAPDDNFTFKGSIEKESDICAVDWGARNLALGQEDGTVSVFLADDVFAGDFGNPSTTISRPTPVRSLAFGASSRFLVVGGDDGMVGVFSSAGDWAMVHRMSVDFSIACLKWSPSGRHLAVSGQANQFKILDTMFWADIQGAKKLQQYPNSPGLSKNAALSFSQDGKLISFVDTARGTQIVSTLSWDTILNLHPPSPSTTDTDSLAVSETSFDPVLNP